MDEEIWKDIEGYEGLYQISNTGKVKSLIKNIILKPRNNGNGYFTVSFNKKEFYIHRLVAKHFLPDYSETLEIDHINNCRVDNKVENLKIVTHVENIYNTNSNIVKPCRIYFNNGDIKEYNSVASAEYELTNKKRRGLLKNYIKKNLSSKKYKFKKAEYI